MSDFIHLHIHSEYSIENSIIRLKSLIENAKKMGAPTLALTDHNNFFAALKFYQLAKQENIKPIIGLDTNVRFQDNTHCRVVFLCQNYKGYQNLCAMLSASYLGKTDEGVFIDSRDLKNHNSGLFCVLCHWEKEFDATAFETTWQALFLVFQTRLYVGVRRCCEKDERINRRLFSYMVQQNKQLPLVALGDVYFLQQEEHLLHEVRVCIQSGTLFSESNEEYVYHAQQYLKTPQQMHDLFKEIPRCIENTQVLAEACELEFELGTVHLPKIALNQRNQSSADILSHQVLDALSAYLLKHKHLDASIYQKRMRMEIEVLKSTGYSDYFLIVSDFVCWAKDNGIPVGPGRGSGAGSLVAYLLKITDIDPIVYDLLFERFLNIERISMPDFDIDFCPMGREKVIQYVTQKYGQDSVAQIVTFGAMAAKAVVRDVGRALGLTYGFVDSVASLIPFDLDMTLEKALRQEPLLEQRYQEDETVHTLIDTSMKLEGIKRNIGKHAGGVVISPEPMVHFLALYKDDSSDRPITHFDKDDLETIGLIKFDFLGLKNLTIIQDTLIHIKKTPQWLTDIPLDDKPTFEMIKKGKMQGIFQLESRGMRDIIRQLQPDKLEEIIDLCALYRPGPIESGMVDNYIAYKKGQRDFDIHSRIRPVLENTNGVILYQEQVMKIAQVLANYTLGQADILRRIIGKKKLEEMQEQKKMFVSGCVENGVPEQQASHIFDMIEKFAGYGFNKSHSAAYGMIAYQTAYLKANYTQHFMASVLSHTMDKADRLIGVLEEIRSMSIGIQGLNVCVCDYCFKVLENQSIAYGLGAVKGLGKSFVTHIMLVRSEQNFTSLEDFCIRADASRFGMKPMMALIESGSLDGFGIKRNVLITHAPMIMQFVRQYKEEQTHAQSNFWSSNTQYSPLVFEGSNVDDQSVLIAEYQLLGQFLSQHPLHLFSDERSVMDIDSFAKLEKTACLLVWLIKKTRQMYQSKKVAVVVFEDSTGKRMEFFIDEEKWKNDYPKQHAPFVVQLEKRYKSQRLFLKTIHTLSAWQSQQTGYVQLTHQTFNSKALKAIVLKYPGSHFVVLNYQHEYAQVHLLLGLKIGIHTDSITHLKNELGAKNVRVFYNQDYGANLKSS